mgnify:CR=1 FL=1
MRLVNYEKKKFIIFLVVLLFFLLIGLGFYTWFKKINSYVILEGRVRKKYYIELMVDSRRLDILYKNGSVYIDDKKYRFSISDITRDVLTNKKIKYSLVLIEVKYEGYDNDYLRLVFNDKRISLKEIFKIIWEGD